MSTVHHSLNRSYRQCLDIFIGKPQCASRRIPVRIDRSKQNYERISDAEGQGVDPYPIKFRAGSKFKVLDGATFEANGLRITLAGAKPLSRGEICQTRLKRIACGTRAYVAMTRAQNGRFVDCRKVAGCLFECRSNVQRSLRDAVESTVMMSIGIHRDTVAAYRPEACARLQAASVVAEAEQYIDLQSS